jgi:hypothetical protein
MEDSPSLNTATLDLSESEDLANYFADKKPGDYCELRIMGTLSESEGEHRTLKIDSVELPASFVSVTPTPEIEADEDTQAALAAIDEGADEEME